MIGFYRLLFRAGFAAATAWIPNLNEPLPVLAAGVSCCGDPLPWLRDQHTFGSS